jgi:hypothetical protein
MKYAVKMGSGAMTYIPSFIEIRSVIQKWVVENTDIQAAWGSHQPTFVFFFLFFSK